MSGSWRVGVDVGGTFTDRAALAADGRVEARKVLSTPGDQGEGVVSSLGALDGTAARIVHGTTVVTNLLLERRGARVVLCATEGATDLLRLRRQDRAALYDLARHHPPPLVSDDCVVAVPERQTARGIERALDAAGVESVVAKVLAQDPDIVVIALLHAYADDRHEQQLATALRAARPTLEVVTSAEVLPEIREYERTATASAEGYARPAVMRYLARLSDRLAAAGHPAPSVMTSGGGMQPPESAARHAAALALSGPAGGVVGAAAVLRALGIMTALTIDIGGTSADAGLILDGEPLVEPGGEVAGVPIALPRVLVDTVSAGGGSIAWVDDGGALRAGPQSAGARPGPIAFGQGGIEPTVTDAQLVLGRIAARAMSGGVQLDVDAARAGLAALGSALGRGPEDVAAAVVAIADAEMARALRRVSVERGVDPRDCTLVAFGGGGPLHACALADALSIPSVLVPPFAGVLSAVGLALAPERHEAAASLLDRCDALSAPAIATAVTALEARVQGSERRTLARVRYVGQGHELDVSVLPGDDGAALAQRFSASHRQRYGFELELPVECVALRHWAGEPAREARFVRDTNKPVFDGAASIDHGGPAPDAGVQGPATIALPDATLFVAPGWRAEALDIGGWRLTRSGP
ncbi:MAG: hydantoinase/oxoprolinase family protein [Gemmatimonadaceae bacterium]|nr:hydantoinase/oxoprolinase family protein [Gemmatimonadaceae bacterium]